MGFPGKHLSCTKLGLTHCPSLVLHIFPGLGQLRVTLRAHPGELGCLSSPEAPSPAPFSELLGPDPPIPSQLPWTSFEGSSGHSTYLYLLNSAAHFTLNMTWRRDFEQSYFTQLIVSFKFCQEINRETRTQLDISKDSGLFISTKSCSGPKRMVPFPCTSPAQIQVPNNHKHI